MITIILISAGLAALIGTTAWVGTWLSRAIDEVFGHEEPAPIRKGGDEHEDVEEVWG